MLLSEEIRRVIQFFEWDAARWESRASHAVASKGLSDPAYVRGRIAYASKQADIRRKMAESAIEIAGDIRVELDEN